MSHIPRLFNNIPRKSDGLKSRKTPIKPVTTIQDATSIFKITPTIQMLQARELPVEIRGRPRIVGNYDHVEILYSYTRNLAGTLFNPSFTTILFPKELSALKQIITKCYQKSKIARKSSIVPDYDPDTNKPVFSLSKVFEKFKIIMKNNPKQIIAICDFCLLYCAIIILICDGDDNQLQALYFLKQVLRLEIPLRTYENSILFAVLVKQGNSEPTPKGHSIQALALMAERDQLIAQRLQAGTTHKDQVLASLCQDAISLMNKSGETQQVLNKNQFQEIPIDSSEAVVEKTLANYENLIYNGSFPTDIIKFMRNVIQLIKKHSDSPLIIEKGTLCIQKSISSCKNIPLEMISEILILCFTILSGEHFLNGSNENSFDALEAIKELTNTIFSIIDPNILLPGIAASIATSSNLVTNLILDRLNEYLKMVNENISQKQLDEIISTIDAFHPSITLPLFLSQRRNSVNAFENMSLSIERLLNSDTVFQEMEEIVSKRDPKLIENYPIYLKGFLQRAYCLYNDEEIPEMSESQKKLVKSMMNDYHSINKEDLINNGKFSIDTLQNQYNNLIKPQNERW